MRTAYKAFLGGLGLFATHVKLVSSHAVITNVAGSNNVTGAGFGMGEHIIALLSTLTRSRFLPTFS